MTRQPRQDSRSAIKRPCPVCNCVLVPFRTLQAIAPSGAEILFRKWFDGDGQISFYFGCLTAGEADQAWRAKLKAERAGIDRWDQARAILAAAGFVELDP